MSLIVIAKTYRYTTYDHRKMALYEHSNRKQEFIIIALFYSFIDIKQPLKEHKKTLP